MTPTCISQRLTLCDGSPATDATNYRSLIGRMQYISLTWLDIASIVNKLSQFMHAPTQIHWTIVKRLLRYSKHTIFYGLFLHRHQPLHLTDYSDAEWAKNQDDCTFISAYVIFLRSNPPF